MMKLLVVRFSSIGDIVLTTPVVRCLKQQLGCELHYLTFIRFRAVMEFNPYIDRLITIDSSISEVISSLRHERYDLIIDLHHNIRTFSLKSKLLRPNIAFKKLNPRKLLFTSFRINLLPELHIVDRYMNTVRRLGVAYDDGGLDFFMPEGILDSVRERIPESHRNGFVAFVIGGRYSTKIYPGDLVASVIDDIPVPVVLLGGDEDTVRGDDICRKTRHPRVFNGCGIFSLHGSAALVAMAQVVITNDTGLMHIAAALRKKIVSLWGNTVPAFGMTPFLPSEFNHLSIIVQMDVVPCRPCSKLGFARCPKGHFDCMRKILPSEVALAAKVLLNTPA